MFVPMRTNLLTTTTTTTYMGAGNAGGSEGTGGGYRQTIVMISSPSISKLAWKRTIMLLVNTRVGFC